MSKLSIYLLALLSFYCYGIERFKPTVSSDKINENKVRLGEEFIVEVNSEEFLISWKFLNKDEVSDSIQFLRKEIVPLYKLVLFSGLRRMILIRFYFKAIKVTNKAKIIKLLKCNYRNPMLENYQNYTVKVNVY